MSLHTFPTKPGCYIHKDSKGTILYIGKAKNLQKRIASYTKKESHTAKTNQLITKIASTEYIITNNELEALLLENTLIKEHQPKYNINLKDDKQYAYVKITNEEFPRIILTRKKTTDGVYFGPFISAESRNAVLNMVIKMFRIRTCKTLPKKVCLRYHMGICSAPCIGEISKEDYEKDITSATKVLQGKTTAIKKTLTEEMIAFSKDLLYEKALLKKKQLHALEILQEKQHVARNTQYDEDIINYSIKNDDCFLMLFNSKKGILYNKQEFRFAYHKEALEEFLVQYYSENAVPKVLILPQPISKTLKEFLSIRRGNKCRVILPKKGEKVALLHLVKENIKETFFKNEERTSALKNALDIQTPLDKIECFDISHLSGTNTTGSMVQFEQGKPVKNEYRRFKIKSVSGIDDFRSIQEIVYRRYKRLKNEKKQFPDLIVIDGGKGQLSFAKKALDELGVQIPIISLAKKDEEIFFPGMSEPLKLDKKNQGLQLLQNIRDEAHRFAIQYNRLRRKIKEE